MIICIAGVLGGADLSAYMERTSFRVVSSGGRQIDECTFTLFDDGTLPGGRLSIPPRAEIVVYDYDPTTLPPGWVRGMAPIVDPPPPTAIPVGYKWDDAGSKYDDVATWDGVPPRPTETPSVWTPRLFGGYVAAAKITVPGGTQRQITVTAQDYTMRNKTTIVNRVYTVDANHPSGWSDQQIIDDIYRTYRPDIDTTGAQVLVPSMPTMPFPAHTLEQSMQRVIKVSQAYYRVDYYKRLSYGLPGTQLAPFDLSDTPSLVTIYSGAGSPSLGEGISVPAALGTVGFEEMHYDPDASQLIDRVWVIGGTFQGASHAFTPLEPADGVRYAFVLPAPVVGYATLTVRVNGVDQGTIGRIPHDGTLDNPSGFALPVLVQESGPPIVAFKTPPASGATISVTVTFRYPLVRIVTDQPTVNALGGLIFEKVVRDRRIDSLALADAVGLAHIKLQGTTKKGGSCVIRTRGANGKLLQPSQSIRITSHAFFDGILPGGYLDAFIVQLRTTVDEDTTQPYRIEVEFSDRPDQDDQTIIDQVLGEQARANAALEQSDLTTITQDVQLLSDTDAATESLTGSNRAAPYTWDGSNTQWGFAIWG